MASLPSNIDYVSFLRYSPKGKTAPSLRSYNFTHAVKNDGPLIWDRKTHRAIEFMVARLGEVIPKHPFLKDLFGPETIVVPMPRSSPLVAGGLWPTMRLCSELVAQGLAAAVYPCLVRHTAVQRSHTATAGNRPGPLMHMESMSVDKSEFPPFSPERLVLVDDVVTKGATILGAYPHLKSGFPTFSVRCFALIRTMHGEVDSMIDPVKGTISLNHNDRIHRNP